MTNLLVTPEQPASKEAKPARPTETLRMSYEEWLRWAGEDNHSEWVNGEVIIFMPPKAPHQILISFLHYLIGTFVEVMQLGRTLLSPIEVRLPQGSAREPDLLFLRTEHLDRMTAERIVGPLDLVVEIISDESVHRDRVDKFDEYEAAGVLEYWILDNRPGRQRAQFFQLDEQGRYRLIPVEADGIYRSQVLPGFWLQVEWLWAEQPDALRAIAAVIGPEQMAAALRRAAG